MHEFRQGDLKGLWRRWRMRGSLGGGIGEA